MTANFREILDFIAVSNLVKVVYLNSAALLWLGILLITVDLFWLIIIIIIVIIWIIVISLWLLLNLLLLWLRWNLKMSNATSHTLNSA